jgi:hypothetical protein
MFKFEGIFKGNYVHLILLKMLSINTKKINLKRFFSSLKVKLLLFLGKGKKNSKHWVIEYFSHRWGSKKECLFFFKNPKDNYESSFICIIIIVMNCYMPINKMMSFLLMKIF